MIVSTLRSLIVSPLFIVTTLILSCAGILVSFAPNSDWLLRRVIKFWGRSTCFYYGVKVEAFGLKNWPYKTGAVVLFNHTSFFDIFAMVGFLPDMRFGAKRELFKIPFFGAAMKRAGILPIDRAKRDRVYQVYEQSTHRLRSGEKIALAPEGERTKTPDVLQKFKAGPFLFALQSGVDIVPVVIVGAYEVMAKHQLIPNTRQWSSRIVMEVLPKVSTEGATIEERHLLQNKIREMMQEKLNSILLKQASNPAKGHANGDVRS